MLSLFEEASKRQKEQRCRLENATLLSQYTLEPNPVAEHMVAKHGVESVTIPSDTYPWTELYRKGSMIYELRDGGMLTSDRFKDEASDIERAVYSRENLERAKNMAVEKGKLNAPPDLNSLLTILSEVYAEEMPFSIMAPSFTPGVMPANFARDIADTITRKAVARLVQNTLIMRESYAMYSIDSQTHGIRGVFDIDRPVSTADGHIQPLSFADRLPEQSWEEQLRDITGTRAPY